MLSLSNYFTTLKPHLEGCLKGVTANQKIVATVGLDDVCWVYDTCSEKQLTCELKNDSRQKFTCLALHPCDDGQAVLGSQSGAVNLLRDFDMTTAEVLHANDTGVCYLQFSADGNWLYIGSANGLLVLYSFFKRRVKTTLQPHHSRIIQVKLSKDNTLCATLGEDGILCLMEVRHTQSDVELLVLDSFRVFTQEFSRIDNKHLQFDILDDQQRKLCAIGGASTLQMATISKMEESQRASSGKTLTASHSFHTPIFQKDPLSCCMWLEPINNRSTTMLVTCSTTWELIIWNYLSSDKILAVQLGSRCLSILPVTSFLESGEMEKSFVCACDLAFHHFTGMHIYPKPVQSVELEIPEQEILEVHKKHQAKGSLLEKLIAAMPQQTLDKATKEYLRNRFLLYNEVGCIVQRLESDDIGYVFLEYHDLSKHRRTELTKDQRYSCHFALKNTAFASASNKFIYFVSEYLLKAHDFRWSLPLRRVSCLALGSDWLAVATDQDIKIFDHAGNQIHNICVDRPVLTMEAYEDCLAVVCQVAVPQWGCQHFRMKLYTVNLQRFQLDRLIVMPITPNSLLKWFGFSDKGIIFAQDTSQIIRCYQPLSNQWLQIYTQHQESNVRNFIQSISGVEIYAFIVNEKPDQHNDPKVLPRSVPRKVPLSLPERYRFPEIPEIESLLLKIFSQKLVLRQQKYRHLRWFRLRAARNQKNPLWDQTKSIMTEEAIRCAQLQHDIKLVDLVKKLVDGVKKGLYGAPKLNSDQTDASNSIFKPKKDGLLIPGHNVLGLQNNNIEHKEEVILRPMKIVLQALSSCCLDLAFNSQTTTKLLELFERNEAENIRKTKNQSSLQVAFSSSIQNMDCLLFGQSGIDVGLARHGYGRAKKLNMLPNLETWSNLDLSLCKEETSV